MHGAYGVTKQSGSHREETFLADTIIKKREELGRRGKEQERKLGLELSFLHIKFRPRPPRVRAEDGTV